MKIGLAILNKNEESALPSVIERIDRSVVTEIFAIDGGSTDNSVNLLVESGIKVLNQTSFGRGEAVKKAIDYSRGRLDAIIFLSSDGNEDPRDIKKFVEALNNNYSLVIGSRMMTGASNEEDIKFFRPRKIGNKFFSVLAFLTFGIGRCQYITDPINGYRAISLKSWGDIKLKSSGYSIEYEMSIESYKKKFKVYEFPTEEMQRIGGVSQATAIKTSFALLKTLFSKLFS
jgi:glycosyltransferase involved in cell wall biosynthesis